MTGDASFLGRGWSFPPEFGPGGAEVAMVAGEEDIAQSLSILFGTALGERVMRETYGCDLSRYMFEEVDQSLLTSISSAVRSLWLIGRSPATLNTSPLHASLAPARRKASAASST